MTKGDRSQEGIPELNIPDNPLQISFKYLECKDEKYDLNACSQEYWMLLVQELKRYASFTISQFEFHDNDDSRHIIDPNDQRVDSASFIKLMEKFEWPTVWQFGLGEKKKAYRVIGMLVDPILFVIRLDSNHVTYTRKEGIKNEW